jgi:hypothetical protein
MKRYLIIFLFVLLASPQLSAQQKVVESSAKKAPAWIGISEDNYIIVSAENATLDGAKKSCLANIQQSIISSVAVHISSTEQLYESMVNNGYNENITRSYESRIEAIAANLPIIQGITLDKAEIYWKKIYDKSDKSYKYEVHAKYPFSAQERNALVAEFDAIENEHNEKFKQISDAFDTFTEVEYIGRAINDLEALYKYYIDQTRKAEVKALMENYRKLYSAISIVPYYNSLGENVFYLNLDGRHMVTSRRPVIRSEYATEIEVSLIEDNLYRIVYNYEYCQPEDDNKIEISYQFANNAVAHYAFYFDVAKGKVEVIPYGQIELDVTLVNAASIEEGEESIPSAQIAQIKGYLDLRCKQQGQFKVTALNLSFDGLNIRVNPEIEAEFEGKGNHRIAFDVESAFDTIKRREGIASGTITVQNLDSKKSAEIRFHLPYKIIL